jgi:hypothetical protein
MSTSRRRRIEQIFSQALEQAGDRRADFVSHICGADAALRDEVASLLTAAQQAPDFLAVPALEVFARQIFREGWTVQPGDRVGCYTVDRRLGAGGMGEVWRARDDRLERYVAIKLLLPHPSIDPERARILQQEARAASKLNHANVVTVYDAGEHRGMPYLVTECLEGQSLRMRLRGGSPPAVDEALDVALQVARGLAAAHQHGIVHRDLKPENIFLTLDGRAKILDFGLAERRLPAANQDDPTPALAAGTPGYMAPEQARGESVDGRADIFALGVVLREMLSGREPLELSRLLQRCLAISPADRFATTAELLAALELVIHRRNAPVRPGLRALLRPPLAMIAASGLLLALAVGGWRWRVSFRERWARGIAPEVQQLLNQGKFADAYLVARRALDILPEDPVLQRLWVDASIPAVVSTEPAGADVALAPYESPAPGWLPLGRTPLPDARIPRGLFRLKVSKPGFETIEVTGSPDALERYRLDPVGSRPAGMVHVVGGRAPQRFGFIAELDDFWIDRLEVTNRQFKAFVDQGGYQRREYWPQPFFDGQRSVSWDDALARFRDSTGRPGPASWKSGSYPAGEADFPVEGVSWYEAAAFAAYAGKSLPTLYHWYKAALPGVFTEIVAASNFGAKGPANVGSHAGLGPFGTYDMAGNVKEWCANELDGRRFLLGGAWNEAGRMFETPDAKPPFARAAGYGIRLAKYRRPPPPALLAAIQLEHLGRDVRKQAPVNDDIFAVYRRLYAYDRTPLNVRLEQKSATATSATEAWQRQNVSLDAAYGGERLHAYLFLPKNAAPPYQTVIYFPPPEIAVARSSSDLSLAWAEPILRSGRAVVYPIYKGTFERRAAFEKLGPSEVRDLRIAWSRDLGRTIDYLETRPDIDRARLVFYAVGRGAGAVVLIAVEPRVKFSVLQGSSVALWGDITPETDAINFAPRVRIPTFMLNPRYDFTTPVETAQRPLFELLGTPVEQKTHTVLDVGRGIPVDMAAGEILPWLDWHVGRVQRLSAANR